jgi:hypothetical protein
LGLIAILGTSACAQIPTSSEVRQGQYIGGGLSNEDLYYSPNPPSLGASQEEIIRGFLNAGTGPQDDYAVARQFLTRDFAKKWKPNEETLVQQGKPGISFLAENRSQVVVQLQSRVDANGVYTIASPDEERNLYISLVEEAGEWRISEAPNLTVLIRPVFDVIFQSYSLYFFDKQLKHLVPDLRWFPSRASTSTRMITELLAGPSELLKDAVETAIPKGTKLSLAAVTVANGIASVDLNAKTLSLSATAKTYLKAQISATLRQLPNVNSVQILVERSPQVIADLSLDINPSAGLSPVILGLNVFSHVSGANPASFARVPALVANYVATDFALSADESRLALRSENGVYETSLSDFGKEPVLIDARTKLIRPVFDRQNYLWSTGVAAGSYIRIVSSSGEVSELPAGWLSLANRVELSISVEGSRLAALVATPTGNQVLVSSIVRDQNGKPVQLGKPIRIGSTIQNPQSLSWSGETQVLILALDPASTAGGVYKSVVGADTVLLTNTTDIVDIIGGPSGELFGLNSFGELFRHRSTGWVLVEDAVQVAHQSGF